MQHTPRHPEIERKPATAGPLVVKLGGAAAEDDALARPLLAAIASLHHAEPAGVVLVHGGGAMVDARLARLGLATERRDGIRLTPEEHMPEIVAALAGVMNTRLVGALQAAGVPAVGLGLSDGFMTACVKADHLGFDPGRVGRVASGDPLLPGVLLRAGYLPVVSSIGLDDAGRPLNLNADDAATALASIVGARALILLTDVPGILDAAGAVLPRLTTADVDARIASGEIRGGMIPKARGAANAAAGAGCPVVIAGATLDNLLRFSRGEHVGTRVVPAAAHAPLTGAAT